MDLADLFGLQGRRVLILGGGQGIGEATARLLGRLGCELAIGDVLPDRAEAVAGELAKAGVRALPVEVDVTDDDSLAGAIAQVQREFGPLDGLACIVGMASWGPLLTLSPDEWDADHRRNLRYVFLAAREVARRIIERGGQGSIVCLASIDGIRGAAYHAAYGAAKAGLVHLVTSMAAEWSHEGVRVNAVAPGGIVTPRIPFQGEAERKGLEMLPMQRRGTVEDIAKALAFFLSDMSAYVTGQTLAVDGGFTAVGPLDYRRNHAHRSGVIGGAPK